MKMQSIAAVLLRIAELVLVAAVPVVAFSAPETPDRQQLMQHPEAIHSLLEEGKIGFDDIPNPHWQADGCSACHKMDSGSNGEEMPPLRSENTIELCGNCHDPSLVADYVHAVGMEPPEDFLDRMPEDFYASLERSGDVVSCSTCHDIPMQCVRFDEKERNPFFFRGGPYDSRTDICFNCHDPKDYERYNPHDQITDEGDLDTEQCFFCHNVTPNRPAARSIEDVSFNVADDLKLLCTGCHPYKPHPGGTWFQPQGNMAGGGPNHLRVPPDEIRTRVENMSQTLGAIMPLEPGTGKIFCATCHNPHERGVQYHRQADVGADGYKRLRRGKYEICLVCHDL